MAGAHLLPTCTICILHEVRGRVSPEGAGEQENAVRLLSSGTSPNSFCGHSYAEHLLNTISVQKTRSLVSLSGVTQLIFVGL